jgi:hypothetical protein
MWRDDPRDSVERIRWRIEQFGFSSYITPGATFNANVRHLIDAMFLTMVEMLRDMQLASRGRPWGDLSEIERRSVYTDVVKRIARNFRSEHNIYTDNMIENLVDALLIRDESIPVEPTCG